ncbi:uncharacterized protein [Drosophila kikkawai]|uniref:Uncharacterized protein n=1 Tax=Drosophila kikkawai TaxID=30033 RepID=A0A6P4JN17_DROKI|nr:uncharacterized protein LOC108084387 [Drosophila kikkawai]
MHRKLLYTLVIIVALALVQASQIHHNLTFPAASQVFKCSAKSHRLGYSYSNRSLTRDLPTLTTDSDIDTHTSMSS